MTLLNDNARCHGQTAYQICAQRETCLRYLDPPKDKRWARYTMQEIPGPCRSYIEAPRREAPGEASEPEQSSQPKE